MASQEQIESCADALHPVLSSRVLPAPVDICERTAAIFRALGDVNRLRLLSIIAQQEMCVSDLTTMLSDNLPAVSQRLKLLRAERLVRTRRQGKHIFYSLADAHIAELIANGLAHGDESDDES